MVVVVAVLGACRMGFDDLATETGNVGRDCGVSAALGALGALGSPSVSVYDETLMPGKITQLSGTIDAELSARIQLWDGYGALAGGRAHTGTFQLAGDDTSAATCGVCVYLSRKLGGSNSTSTYTTLLAVGGVVEITQLGATGTDASATITSVDFAELDTNTSALIDGGCMSSIDTASVTAQLRTTTSGVSRGGHGGDGAGSGSGGGDGGD